MTKLFISHSTQDKAFVREFRKALADHGQEGWIDSRELRGGDPLWPEIQKEIEAADAFAVVVSPDALQSKWVGKELRHALALREKRGNDEFPVIPLSLDGTKLGVLEEYFGEEPLYIRVSSEAGGVEAAMSAVLGALRERLPADVVAAVQPKAEPLEELVLELTDFKFHEQDGVPRPSARARLVYEPATSGQPKVTSVKSWRLIAPVGPIEAEEMRWYLEKYAIWPSHYFRDRAQKVEEDLVNWGQQLYEAAMPVVYTTNVINAWSRISDHAGRRFSVYVDTNLEDGAPEADVKTAKEAATLMLALPWELLHNGDNYLFQGAKPVRVRRRLPNTKVLDVPAVATPIRILLVTARPEDDACSYIDHRASALPLVEAMESLPGLVEIHVLSPPTLKALSVELDRARDDREPYHVVHFDGHGVFNREVGLGGLCFEKPEDTGRLENRGHVTVFTNQLGPLLHDHRIPLVFLEACQTAQAQKASESVASELLRVGVASVVAMSHSVLIETSRRFVKAFYEALADGKRLGDAMLAGQRELKDDTFRGRIFGAGELRLEDWFVPVLYQEKDDPQLFKITPSKQTQEDFQAALAIRLGNLPSEPKTGFIGRSRELLALQRLLRDERYAVIRGQGGEGKTALAAEFARWMVRSQQVERAAFVSVETYGNQRAVVDALGKQLVNKKFSAAGDVEEAIKQVERELREQPTLLVIDNMESVLLPPFIQDETPEVLSEEAAEELTAILALCKRLLRVDDTRIIFTSREPLPTPFDAARNRRELYQLDRDDAVKLVERVLNAAGDYAGTSRDAASEEIEELVDAVNCHARTLALLAPSLRERGVKSTRESLVELMTEMRGSRETSVFASVELSLRRMSQTNQDRVRVLGLFHGGVSLGVLRLMMPWQETDIASLAGELIETGLATPDPYKHLTLNPALCPYLRGRMEKAERETLIPRWIYAMYSYVEFLRHESNQNAEVAATLTSLDLPDLFALIDLSQEKVDAETTVELATSLYGLLKALGKPRLLERVGKVRDVATAALGDTWTHAQFHAVRTRIEQELAGGRLQEALIDAQELLQRARTAGDQAYPEAHYDLGMACFLRARVLRFAGESDQAIILVAESHKRFDSIKSTDRTAAVMVTRCLEEKGKCLFYLGRLDEAARTYGECIQLASQLGDNREIAVGRAQLGNVRTVQHRYPEALTEYEEARRQFTLIGDSGAVAASWHQEGMVHRLMESWEAAEDAYQKSLAINVRLENLSGQAATLAEIGGLYDDLNRYKEAATFLMKAAEINVKTGDVAKQSIVRNNLAIVLSKSGDMDNARREIRRAIECNKSLGQSGTVWNCWAVLAEIEAKTGNSAAAADANGKAIAGYLAYRRNGGENHNAEGRISLAITQPLLTGDLVTTASLLQQFDADSNTTDSLRTFIRALQAIVAGNRDRALADEPDLDYSMAAEILFFIETLENQKLDHA